MVRRVRRIDWDDQEKSEDKTDVFNTFTFAIPHKRSVSARVDLIEDGNEKVGRKLKVVGKLVDDLPRAVDELQKDGRSLAVIPWKQKAASIRELRVDRWLLSVTFFERTKEGNEWEERKRPCGQSRAILSRSK